MASSTGQSVIRHLRRAAAITDEVELSDADLLAEFVARRDEGAFAVLVRRHGPMVLMVCRRVLNYHADAEDAFQAAFMVLARRAGSIAKPALLANWLYGVAFRTALEARTQMIRRNSTQKPLSDSAKTIVEPDEDRSELLALLDRELNRLPDKFRVPVVMCELEGRGRKEVAGLLRIPEGTLSSRLASARKLLAQRLTRRGVAVTASGVGLALSQSKAPAAVSAALIDSTVAAAVTTKAVPAAAAVLMKGVLTAMFINKLQRVAVATIVLGLGSGVLTLGVIGGKSAAAKAGGNPTPLNPSPDDRQTAGEKTAVVGGWKLESFIMDGKEPPEGQHRGLDHIYFAKDKGYFIDKGKPVLAFKYATDSSEKPAHIDLTAEGKPDTLKGIFELNGDTLKLSFSDGGPRAGRPAEFESKSGSRIVAITLKRDGSLKEPDEKEAAKWSHEAGARMISENNLKQLGLAMHNFLSTYNTFPAHAIYNKDGKPLLSWRVAILPYIDQNELYKEFHLDEPWDSEHNKKLLDKMPKVYGEKGTETHYRVFVGKGAIFEGKEGIKIQDITDGTSNTILIVEGPDTVPWSKPADYEYDASKELPKLGGKPFENGIHACFADGAVRLLPNKITEKTLRALITRNGGEIVDPNTDK
jgi:RNA polymerase sigma factor (sigma-70 family)